MCLCVFWVFSMLHCYNTMSVAFTMQTTNEKNTHILKDYVTTHTHTHYAHKAHSFRYVYSILYT